MRKNNRLVLIVFIIAVFLCGCQNHNVEVLEESQMVIEATSFQEIVLTESTIKETLPEIEPSVAPVKKLDYFREDIYYDYEYVDSGELIPHALFTPSTASEYEKIPLILWLHGGNGNNCEEVYFRCSGLLKVLTLWDFMHLDGLNAYMVAPQLMNGDFWSPYWCTEESRVNVKDLLDYYIENYNVDPDKIVVCGHSLGGQGTLYMAQVLPEYFCAMAPLSVYNPCTPITNTDIPTWCFEGKKECGEDSVSVDYAFTDFKHKYGEECITSLPVGHLKLPFTVFSMDNDANGRMDLFEWFAEQMQANE